MTAGPRTAALRLRPRGSTRSAAPGRQEHSRRSAAGGNPAPASVTRPEGCALFVAIAAELYASRLVVPSNQRMPATR